MPNGAPWPCVTVVTPSLNQAAYIEETIRSVLLQGYPDLDYLVIDGGSTDGTVALIEKYGDWLSHWASEPDRGQGHAINKGWRRGRGDAVSWLNSDDRLELGALCFAAQHLAAHDETDLVYGNVAVVNSDSAQVGHLAGAPFDAMGVILRRARVVPQPGFLMRRRLLDTVGWLDEDLRFTMDYDYWTRVALAGCEAEYLDRVLASFRTHALSKTSRQQPLRIRELYLVFEKVMAHPRLPRKIAQERRRWRAALDLDAARIAYRAGDASLVRAYATAHLRSARARASVLALLYLAVSCLGNKGMSSLGRAYRASKAVLAQRSTRERDAW